MADGGICRQDELENIIRTRLTQDRVQLWVAPFTVDDGSKGEKPQELIDKYSTELGLDRNLVESTLELLRQNAVDKLSARKKFQQSGLATLKVKVAGLIAKQGLTSFSVEIGLDSSGIQLKQMIADRCKTTVELLKLICCGHIIDDARPLAQQNIKNNAVIMAIGTTEAASKESEYFTKVAKTREAAQLLSESMDDDDPDKKYQVQIADQTGKPLKLPPEESKALALAMTLHEKGKSALKRQEFSEALLYLLEADTEFKKCRADILNAVDNYAVLCLDIVWCYLCIKNVRDLPDAESRLLNCEQCFHKSYGVNLERLRAVKGEVGSEMALFMRLHLLQGILAFHQNRIQEALQLLRKAETELKMLQVDDDKLTQVMTMGFTHQEARLGLRSCEGDVEGAVQHIMLKQQERKDRIKKEKEERRQKKQGKVLGKTNKGKWLDTDSYESMLSMGFPAGAAREALRLAENDVTAAIQILQDKPEIYDSAVPTPITDDMVAQVASLGFDPTEVMSVLQTTGGDVQKAIDLLLTKAPSDYQGGNICDDRKSESGESPGTSSASSSPTKSSADREKEKAAIESLMPDIPDNEEDYLDLTLEQEAQFLGEYMSLISSLKQ